jgi:multiple sugar transport system permease protein
MNNNTNNMLTDRQFKKVNIFWTGRRKVSYSFISPAFVILLFLAIGPMIFMFWNAFRTWKLSVPAPAKFVGFQNFINLFQDTRFWNAFSNTIILMIVGIIIQSLIGLGIALLLKDKFRFRNIVVALILIPVLIAPVVIGLNWKLLLNNQFGPINYFLSLIGIQGPLWISSNKFWGLLSILIVDTWQWTPFVALVLLSGLQGIPNQVYEAADVDGARPLRVFFKVTLPLLKPMFTLIVLLRIIFMFRIYDPVVILTGGGPGTATETLSLLTYNTGLGYLNIGYAMAMGVIQIIFMIIVANIFLKFTSQNKNIEV